MFLNSLRFHLIALHITTLYIVISRTSLDLAHLMDFYIITPACVVHLVSILRLFSIARTNDVLYNMRSFANVIRLKRALKYKAAVPVTGNEGRLRSWESEVKHPIVVHVMWRGNGEWASDMKQERTRRYIIS